MRLIRNILLFIFVAVGLGIGSAFFAVNNADRLELYQVGPWRAWPKSAGPEANPYTQADQARSGALRLGTAEGIAFVAENDDDGTPLDGACQYRIDGGQIPSRLWTMTLIDTKGTLVDNPSRRYAFHSNDVARIDGNRFEIVTGPDVMGGNWLRSEINEPFRLILRLYETSLTSGGGFTDVQLPRIAWMSCQ